jgi:hypothetical protein
MAAPFTVFGMSPALPLALLGVVIMVVTMIVEKAIEAKHDAALIPQSFLKTRQVRNGLYVTGLIFAIFGSAFFVTLSWIMVVAGKSGAATGIAMSVMAAPMIVLSIGIPKKFSHVSPRFIILLATAAAVLGAVAMLSSLRPDGFDAALMYAGLALVGIGQGCYASQSAMIVASALNPRDAAQSGGIQCSTRNVWQAAGVAIIGAVLLFSSTAFYKSAIEASNLDQTVKAYVADTPVHGFMSNQDLISKLSAAGVAQSEAEKALAIYKQTRVKSAQWAFWSLAILILLHIPGFMGIPTQGWSPKPDAPTTKLNQVKA